MKANCFVVAPAQHPVALVDFLAQRLQRSKKHAKRLLDARVVLVNDRRVWMARHVLQRGDRVEVQPGLWPIDTSERLVLFQDADYLVCNKPAGFLANGPESIESKLRTLTGLRNLRAVHRLDRDTSGCLLFATGPRAADNAIELFRRNEVVKIYQAIVAGSLGRPRGMRATPLDGRTALTHVQLLDACEQASHIKVKLETGRTHQIRKHMAEIGHPVLGDKRYFTGRMDTPLFRTLPRQMLHASSLHFLHPRTKQPVRVKAPLPADYRKCLKALRLR